MKQRINYFRLFSFLRSFVMSPTMLRELPRKSRGMGGNTGAFWVCFSSPNTQHLQHFLNIVVIQEEPEFHLIHHPSLHLLISLLPTPTHLHTYHFRSQTTNYKYVRVAGTYPRHQRIFWKYLGMDNVKEGFPGDSMVKNPPANAGDTTSIPGSGRSPGEGNGNPFQYSCLESSMD